MPCWNSAVTLAAAADWPAAGHHSQRSAAATVARCAAAAGHAAAVLVPVTPSPTRSYPRTPALTTPPDRRCCAPLQVTHTHASVRHTDCIPAADSQQLLCTVTI